MGLPQIRKADEKDRALILNAITLVLRESHRAKSSLMRVLDAKGL